MKHDTTVAMAAAMLVAALFPACGQGEPQGPGGSPAAAAATGLVSPDAVRNCAHFSADDAAAVLGVPADQIDVRREDIHETLRMCSYISKSDRRAVSFSLATNDTIDDAVSAMASGRENAGLGRRSIDAVTGTTSGGPALDEVEGIGDEAFWMEINGTLNVRVKNVEIQVQTPDDREQQKDVARRVVSGLAG